MNMSPTLVCVNLVGSILESTQVKNTAVGWGLSRTLNQTEMQLGSLSCMFMSSPAWTAWPCCPWRCSCTWRCPWRASPCPGGTWNRTYSSSKCQRSMPEQQQPVWTPVLGSKLLWVKNWCPIHSPNVCLTQIRKSTFATEARACLLHYFCLKDA